jgi:hypothetical protein
MKTVLSSLLVTVALALGAVAAAPLLATAPVPAVPAAGSGQSPFYCDQAALDPERRKRHFDVLGPEMVAKRKAVRELPDGYEFEFPSDALTYQHLVEWMDGERECCPFFDFSLRVAAEHGPLQLRVGGRPGAKAFIQADAAAWIRP